MSATAFIADLKIRAKELKARSEFRTLNSVTAYTGRYVWIEGIRYLNVGSNDYLGLSVNAALIARVRSYLDKGTGNCSSRLILGNSTLYRQVEDLIAEWKDMDRALVLSSGYAINVAVMQSLAVSQRRTIFLFDRLVHASMIDGVRATGKKWESFKHNDLIDLERLLIKYHNDKEVWHIVVLTEAVFSMDGDLAPILDILMLAKKYDVLCYIDEAHALGVYGVEGSGFSREFRFKDYPNVISVGTFGKSVGVGGAYIAATSVMTEHFINTMRSFIYSTALAPVVLGTIFESIKIIRSHPELGKSLIRKSIFLRKALKDELKHHTANPSIIHTEMLAATSPIIPVTVGSSEVALALSNHLRRNGIWAPAIRPPTVRRNCARIRLSLNDLLLESDLKDVVASIADFFKNENVR
ncbi:8-amino-7-oxononanoate synthase [Spirochaetota bacterium]|nr:8-amino-7-oxononanoate synthase [Spirochaetota bacterium]